MEEKVMENITVLAEKKYEGKELAPGTGLKNTAEIKFFNDGTVSVTALNTMCNINFDTTYTLNNGKLIIAPRENIDITMNLGEIGLKAIGKLKVKFSIIGNLIIIKGTKYELDGSPSADPDVAIGEFTLTENDIQAFGITKKSAFGAKIKQWFKDLIPSSEKKSKVKFKTERMPIRKTFSIFKGVKLPWILIALALVCSVAQSIIAAYTIEFSAKAIDANGNIPTQLLTEYILFSVIQCAIMVGSSLFILFLTNKINDKIRIRLWDKLLKLYQKDLGKDGGEQMLSRISVDSAYPSVYFSGAINTIRALVTAGVYIFMMYKLNTTLANYTMIFVPLSIALIYLISWLKFKVIQKKQGFIALETAYLVERTKDLSLIKTCLTQKKEIEIGNEYFDRQYTNQIQIGAVGYLSTLVDTLFNILTNVIPFAVGAILMEQGAITLGVILAFNTLIGSLKTAFIDGIGYVSGIKEANGGAARLVNIINLPEEPLNIGTSAPDGNLDLTFEKVTFGYVDDKNVYEDITFTIPKNKVTAILGKNGSGKTTSFKLIERLYSPNSGAIKYGDDNIADYSLSSWRNKICLVQQGGALMTGTLRSNICYGRDDVTDEEFERAVKLAHVSDFAEKLPDKYDSPVAVDGSNYSGGQRQCIALARAMLSPKPYLLLDEATCNLDAKREADVMDALENLIKERTTIIIAHSIGTIKHADHVIVLGNGKVESIGSPADILKETDNYLAKMMQRAHA